MSRRGVLWTTNKGTISLNNKMGYISKASALVLWNERQKSCIQESWMARLLMSLYISWQMKTNACESAPQSRGAFHKLITCNSILVHLGARRAPGAGATGSAKQEKHSCPSEATSPEGRRFLWMAWHRDLHRSPLIRLDRVFLSHLTSGFH